MKDVLLTTLRDETTSIGSFREAATQLAQILAADSSQHLPKIERTVKTPLGQTQGFFLAKEPVLVSILRSGLALLPSFMHLYPKAPAGFIGVRRDEKTAEPHLYYSNIPRLSGEDWIFLLEPMVATGQTAVLAIKQLKEAGASESKIVLFSILAAMEGLAHIRKIHPGIQTNIVHVDPQLDPKKWIVPGLGDFGDRYFGTNGSFYITPAHLE